MFSWPQQEHPPLLEQKKLPPRGKREQPLLVAAVCEEKYLESSRLLPLNLQGSALEQSAGLCSSVIVGLLPRSSEEYSLA